MNSQVKPASHTAPDMHTGGAKKKTKVYNGHVYVVRKGEQGGKYILVKGKKIYV